MKGQRTSYIKLLRIRVLMPLLPIAPNFSPPSIVQSVKGNGLGGTGTRTAML